MVSPSRKVAVVLTVLGIMLLAVSATVLGNYYFGHGRAGRTLSSAPLPPGFAAAPSPSQAPAVSPTAVPERLGVPVTVIVADHHLQAPVSADRLNPDGSLYVPPNPRAVSWSSQDVAPGSGHGTIILVGHVNYGGVAGAFADLADYRVGQIITLVLADGRRLNYAVAAPPIEGEQERARTSTRGTVRPEPLIRPRRASQVWPTASAQLRRHLRQPHRPLREQHLRLRSSCMTSPSALGSTSIGFISASGQARGRSRFLGDGL